MLVLVKLMLGLQRRLGRIWGMAGSPPARSEFGGLHRWLSDPASGGRRGGWCWWLSNPPPPLVQARSVG
jgi:hypothetical protein